MCRIISRQDVVWFEKGSKFWRIPRAVIRKVEVLMKCPPLMAHAVDDTEE